MVNAKPGRLAVVPAMLDQALALAGVPARSAAMTPPAEPTNHSVTVDPGSQAMAEPCLDPDTLRMHLAQALGRPVHALRITQVRRNTSRRRNPHPLQLALEADLAGQHGGGWQTFHGRLCRDAAGAQALLADTAAGATDSQPAAAAATPCTWCCGPGRRTPACPSWPPCWTRPRPCPGAVSAPRAVQVLRYKRGPARQPALPGRHGCGPARLAVCQDLTATTAPLPSTSASSTSGSRRSNTAAHLPWPRPLGHDAATRTFWQASASGTPLPALLHSGLSWLPGQVARAWAAVHQAPLALAGPQARDRAHWLAELARRRKKVARALPALAPRPPTRLVAALQQASSRLPEPPLSLIHGDCHPDQLWLQGQRVVLFDFDEFKPGDPMEDLAEFLAKLAPDGTEAVFGRALLEAYAEAAPDRLHMTRLHWHLAVQHLLQAARAFGFQRPGWPDEMAARLGRAQAAADNCLAETDR